MSASGDGENLSGDAAPLQLILEGGQSGSLTFTPQEAGEYVFYCAQPGHQGAGMEGTLTVE